MKTVNEVSNLINCLTTDEDLRQELWLHYLSGNQTESLSSYLNKLKIQYSEDEQLRAAMWQLLKTPLSPNLLKVMEHFSDFERSIMCLLMLGLSVEKIAEYKGINEVRIRQVVSTIRYNSNWVEYYGIEKEPIR